MPRLLLIRHTAITTPALLAGRTDLPATLPGPDSIARAQACLAALAPDAALISSPLQRCTQTAGALFPGRAPQLEPRLQEQDFGAWDGQPLAALPDLGPLPRAALAAHCPPGGESFLELAARARPALLALTQDTLIFTHAGIIRAALGLALGDIPQGLAFAIAPFSLTVLEALPGGDFAITCTNLDLAS